ncbi:phage putative head morphogenesis protein, SPP1 gp7 family [Thermoflavimicrobium dichotomicum]|uniref:Phage putative head morphogenesis protein, SPP1 gp7 family n=2 Tax=Thermoflavimicrobium dichotomicum TaxID=46223 RepID=A0A1I3UHY3_9BACL|nr:phage putative head morphogenesis protein, SPP1 gp7 family [Thermoflavimicrobium dichotomicum]
MEKRMDRILAKTEKTLLKEYRNALKKIRAELAQLYGTFPLTGAKSLEARRLRNLEIFILNEINRIYRNNQSTLYDSLSEMYNMTGWAIEMEIGGAQMAWGVINPDVIRRAVMAPIDKLTLNDRLERNRRKIIAEIKHQLTQGLIMGNSYEKIAQRIKNVLEQDVRKARVIARTEGHRIRNTGKFDSAKRAAELGLEMVKVWDATLDHRTRPAHRKLDGKKVGVNENFISPAGGIGPGPGMMNHPKDDIQCRCIFRLEFPGFEPQKRRIRGEGVQPYTTYERWAKARGFKVGM